MSAGEQSVGAAVERVLSFEAARHAVEEHASGVRPVDRETLSLLEAGGRVLAEEIVADRDLPPFPRATRDGFAVRAADAKPLAELRIVAEVKAGEMSSIALGAGEAAEIMTGAPVPDGADAVIMVEYTELAGSTVRLQRGVQTGENVVPRGAEAHSGAVLLSRGMRLTPAAIAAAASVGKSRISVWKKPRVAILATGDELVDVAAHPEAHQIRNSNSYSLAAQVQATGAEAVILPVAPDEREMLRKLVREGLAMDLLLMSGGVSMGKYDLVEQVLEELGAEFLFTGAQIQPGKPIVFGRAPSRSGAESTYFFGLPGNPVSTMVCFELFAKPMISALAGASAEPLRFPRARLKSEVKTKTGLTRFLPATFSGEFGETEVELVRWQGSGDIAATARANCFLVIPPDRDRIPAGEMVSVLMPGGFAE